MVKKKSILDIKIIGEILGKKFILNADDFGMNKAFNRAVLEGYQCGILKSVSIVANGEAFDEAVQSVIPACEGLGVGVHLNIIEGKSLNKDFRELTDKNQNFINSYHKLLFKALNHKNKLFLEETEEEFRSQIEKVKKAGINITHIDSHVHVHSIPPIFNIVCKLAKEYGVNQVRTQFEKPYMIPDVFVHLNSTYPLNLVKIALLNSLTIINKKTIKQYGLKTNDFLIGVGYTSMMSSLTVACGLDRFADEKDVVVEALIHPCRYEEGFINNHFVEYQLTKNQKLKEKIENLEFEITNYVE